MNLWSSYMSRVDAVGATKRDAARNRCERNIRDKIASSLSYRSLLVNGETRSLAVINSDDLNIKMIYSVDGYDIPHGGYVDFAGNKWLITEKDADTEIYARAKMQQCNYLLRWISKDGDVVERWCIVEDGTKYLTGEFSDKNFVVSRGDARVTITLPLDKQSLALNRESRFLIDDYGSEGVLAYRLTKPLKLGGSFNGAGVLRFVLVECNTEDTDNFDLHIANYYKYFPREGNDTVAASYDNAPQLDHDGKRVWL